MRKGCLSTVRSRRTSKNEAIEQFFSLKVLKSFIHKLDIVCSELESAQLNGQYFRRSGLETKFSKSLEFKRVT